MIDWLTSWLIERLTCRLTREQTGWVTDWLTDHSTDLLTDWLTERLTCRLIIAETDQVTDWQTDCLASSLLSIDWLTCHNWLHFEWINKTTNDGSFFGSLIYSFGGRSRGGIGWLATPPPLGSFKLEIMKGNRAITEAILSLIVPKSFCQVSHPPFKNPGSTSVSQ